jgi:peptide/nickel transport system permease protein
MVLGYVVRRFGMLLLVVFFAVSVNFIIPRLMPGDPIEQKMAVLATSGGDADLTAMAQAYREKFGLDQPVWRQYIAYWGDLARFDLGYSLANYPMRVSQTILAALPWTLGLVGVSTLISFVIGSLLGGVLAWPDTSRGIRAIALPLMVISAIPYFLLGMVLIYVFALRLQWFPAGGGYSFSLIMERSWVMTKDIIHHAILPSIAVIVASLGRWAINMRGAMVSTLGEDFVTLAEAKGLPPTRIFFNYGVRNSLLPQLTQLALRLGYVVAGIILVEVVFAYPGLGYQLFQAIQAKDYFVIQGIVLVLILTIALSTFIMDLIYPLIDPRITFRRR